MQERPEAIEAAPPASNDEHEVIRLDSAACQWKQKVGAALLAWGQRTEEELQQFEERKRSCHLSLVHNAERSSA